jgi:hypothetical protein
MLARGAAAHPDRASVRADVGQVDAGVTDAREEAKSADGLLDDKTDVGAGGDGDGESENKGEKKPHMPTMPFGIRGPHT